MGQKRRRVWIVLSSVVLGVVLVAAIFLAVSCGVSKKSVPTRYGFTTWLELPSTVLYDCEYCETHHAEMEGRMQRNYTFMYDFDTFTSVWVAYPLCESHIRGSRGESWSYDPKVPADMQTSVVKGYGVSCPTENYPKNFYARGHQLPDADRSGVPSMQEQTYYSTNITPQLQNGFNAAIWKDLEAAVRETVPEGDTLYVVTGACFDKKGENSGEKIIVNRNDSKSIAVPAYYWKALLKVRREADKVIDAATIGFWLPHEDLKGCSFEDYVVSVDQIEEWTGFDLFVNLSDKLQHDAEDDVDWNVFFNI